MALWKITTKIGRTINGIRIEKGLSVEVIMQTYSNPISTSLGRKQIADAFMRKYGIDMEKACMLSATYLDGVKAN
jgi:hypothetical protein